MALTAVQICNLALARLGENPNVGSIGDLSLATGDASANAAYCALFYNQALQTLLDKHAWSFATATAALVAADNANPFWSYAYQLPTDFLGVIAVREPVNADAASWVGGQNYALESGVLYSNLPAAVLVYTSGVALDPAQFPPLFTEALAVLLASYLAGPVLKGDVGVAAQNRMLSVFALAFKEAVESDGQYRKVGLGYVPEGVLARR